MKDTSQLVDMYQGVLDGAGWTTDDYILNAKHSPLSDKEKVVLILQLSKAGILADANKITGKEKEKNQVPSEAFMSPHDVMSKHGKNNIPTNESVNEAKQTYSKPNKAATKKLKGMVKIKAVQFKQGHNFYYYDKKTKKWWFVDSEGDLMELRSEYVLKQVYAFIKQNQINIDESISKDDKFKIYNKLKKGDIIDIDYGSSIRKTTKGKFKVSKGKTIVGKRKVERIILQNIANPTGTKYYLYNSGGSIGMAIGDMAATINSMQKSVNEAGEYVEKHNNENKISMQIYKKVGGNEIKFYDELEHLHDKMGHPKYMKWLSGALRGYNVDMFRTSKIKNKGEAEEALYILSKK